MVSVLEEPADFILRVEVNLKMVAPGFSKMLVPIQLHGLTSQKTVIFRFPDYLSHAFSYNPNTSLNDRVALAHYYIQTHC
jgi:hypothetical protein